MYTTLTIVLFKQHHKKKHKLDFLRDDYFVTDNVHIYANIKDKIKFIKS